MTNLENFKLGDIVELVSRSEEHGLTALRIKSGDNTTIYRTGHTKMIPPPMVVIETVLEKTKGAHLFDEQSGEATKDPIKIHCQWFSHSTNKFQSRWFNIGVLKKIATIEFEDEEFKLNQVVSLKTVTAHNVKSENIIEHSLKGELRKTEIKITKTFDTSAYLPPKMVVTGILKNEEKPIFDKSTGKQKRFASEKLIKCIWYDYMTGKYSEHSFSKESLISISKLGKDFFLNQFTPLKDEQDIKEEGE